MGSMIDITSDAYSEKGLEYDWSAIYAKRLLDEHTKESNPHAITKETVGLANVDNAKQATKAEFELHTSDINNPHSVTKAQVGLANVDNVKQATKAEFDTFSHTTQQEISDVRGEIPKNVSELANDIGYITEHQDISYKADISYVDREISNEANNRFYADSVLEERINKIKYYGDADIEISPDEWFSFADDEHTILKGLYEDYRYEQAYVIPYSVTRIDNNVFFLTNLTSITIPKSVTSIGNSAFLACHLRSITIPDSVTSIGCSAFEACSYLKSITIPDSVISIGSDAFLDCDNVRIHCSQGSYADTYAKSNRIPVVYTDIQESSITSPVKTSLDDTVVANVIYDLGVQTAMNIKLPSGKVGDFIQVDFISGEAETTLTVNSSSGLTGFDLIPGKNTIYTLYFDWGEIGYDGETVTYGWRFNYSEYSIDVI